MWMRDRGGSNDGRHARTGASGRVGVAWAGGCVFASIGAGPRRAHRAEAGHRGAAATSRGANDGASFTAKHASDGARRPRTNDSRPGCQDFLDYGQRYQAKDYALRFGGRSAFGGDFDGDEFTD